MKPPEAPTPGWRSGPRNSVWGRTGAGLNRLAGRVESVTYLGAIVRVRVQVTSRTTPDGPLVAVDLFNERQLRIPQVGETVEVTFPPHACWIVI